MGVHIFLSFLMRFIDIKPNKYIQKKENIHTHVLKQNSSIYVGSNCRKIAIYWSTGPCVWTLGLPCIYGELTCFDCQRKSSGYTGTCQRPIDLSHSGNGFRTEVLMLRPPNTFETYRQFSNIRRTQSQNINVSRLVLQLSLPNPLKPSENEHVVGAAPTGDAPSTSEWSTRLLPTKVGLIHVLETLR